MDFYPFVCIHVFWKVVPFFVSSLPSGPRSHLATSPCCRYFILGPMMPLFPWVKPSCALTVSQRECVFTVCVCVCVSQINLELSFFDMILSLQIKINFVNLGLLLSPWAEQGGRPATNACIPLNKAHRRCALIRRGSEFCERVPGVTTVWRSLVTLLSMIRSYRNK